MCPFIRSATDHARMPLLSLDFGVGLDSDVLVGLESVDLVLGELSTKNNR